MLPESEKALFARINRIPIVATLQMGYIDWLIKNILRRTVTAINLIGVTFRQRRKLNRPAIPFCLGLALSTSAF